MRIARESWILSTICIADLFTTLWFVRDGGAMEGNPVMRFYLEHGILPFILAKLLLFLGPLVVLEWARSRRPRFVRTMLRLGITFYLGAYGVVWWRTNGTDNVPKLSQAQMTAISQWSQATPTAHELSQLREQLRNQYAAR